MHRTVLTMIGNNMFAEYVKNTHLLEIGGPTNAFGPIYNSSKMVDGVSYSDDPNLGFKSAGPNQYTYYPNKNGHLYVCDGTNLSIIDDNSYDGVLSSHNLEHLANPFKAIAEWIRVTKSGGYIVLRLPRKETCFDWKRSITSFEHILSDYENNMGEDDLTHVDEIVSLHDRSMDRSEESESDFRHRAMDNFALRGLHHHVFDGELISKIFKYFNIEELSVSHDNIGFQGSWDSIGRVIK